MEKANWTLVYEEKRLSDWYPSFQFAEKQLSN